MVVDNDLGALSISEKTSYREIPQSLVGERSVIKIFVSPWSLIRHIGSSVAEVPATFQSDRTILNTNLATSRSYNKTSYWISDRALVSIQPHNIRNYTMTMDIDMAVVYDKGVQYYKISRTFFFTFCVFNLTLTAIKGLYSLSGKTSYSQISWSLEVARLDVAMAVSLWNLTGTLAAALPRYLPNFRAIGKV